MPVEILTTQASIIAMADTEPDYSVYENKTGLADDLKFLASMPELCDVTFLVGDTREPVCAVKVKSPVEYTYMFLFPIFVVLRLRSRSLTTTTRTFFLIILGCAGSSFSSVCENAIHTTIPSESEKGVIQQRGQTTFVPEAIVGTIIESAELRVSGESLSVFPLWSQLKSSFLWHTERALYATTLNHSRGKYCR